LNFEGTIPQQLGIPDSIAWAIYFLPVSHGPIIAMSSRATKAFEYYVIILTKNHLLSQENAML